MGNGNTKHLNVQRKNNIFHMIMMMIILFLIKWSCGQAVCHAESVLWSFDICISVQEIRNADKAVMVFHHHALYHMIRPLKPTTGEFLILSRMSTEKHDITASHNYLITDIYIVLFKGDRVMSAGNYIRGLKPLSGYHRLGHGQVITFHNFLWDVIAHACLSTIRPE